GASYDQERFEMQKHFTAEKNKRTLDDIVLKVSNKKADDLQSDSDNSSEVNRNDDQQSSLYETSVKTLYTLTVANLQGVGISEHHAETLSEDLRSNISRMLAKSVRSDAQYEYVDYDRSEENPADIIIIGTAGSTGNTCYVFARLVHVETGRIVACLKRYQEDFFDTIIADISADVRNVLFDATWVESAVLAVPYGAEQICYTLCAFDLDPNNIDTSEAEIISEKLRTEVYQIVLSSDYKNKNLREKFIPVERSQIKKIIDHVLIDRADSSAIEYGKLQQLDNIIIGSISKTGDTYSVIARNIDVESSKTVHETECEHRGSVEEILDELIPEVAHDLVYGK
ncbi:MAG: hypothetical protein JXB48_04940, partial [Candidatus Latescibacteria bacterium]|nr:hypothetical protein [Candidatus Latescibacterota bacterium]